MNVDARDRLFTSGDRPEWFSQALASRLNAVILDYEDAVAPDANPGRARVCRRG